MKNVLFVDCCIRREASNTKKLAEAFLAALPSDCAVTRLDLMAEDISYFKDSYFDQREALLAENRRDHPRFRYAPVRAGRSDRDRRAVLGSVLPGAFEGLY